MSQDNVFCFFHLQCWGGELFGAGCTTKRAPREFTRLSTSHEFGFGPNTTSLFLSTSPSALIFSPASSHSAALRPQEEKRPERTHASTEIPAASRTNPSNSLPFASAPANSWRKAGIFPTFSLAPGPLFPFFDSGGPVLYRCS
jgi:hypothetical protein